MRWVVMRALVLCCLTSGVLAGQSADSAGGRIVRIRTVRSVGERTGAAKYGGVMIRQLGALQRIDMLRTPADSAGTEWATMTDAPLEMLLHSPARKSTMVLTFDDMRTVFRDLLHASMDSLVTEAEDLGAGPRTLGYETRRVRYNRSFRMTTALGSARQTLRVVSVTEALLAPRLPESIGTNTLLSMTSGNNVALLEQLFGAGAGAVRVRGGGALPTGLALRSVTRTRTHATGGSVSPLLGTLDTAGTVDTMEVVSITAARLRPDLFAAPAGYERVDFGTQMRSIVTLLDSLQTSLSQLGKAAGKPVKPYKPAKPYKP